MTTGPPNKIVVLLLVSVPCPFFPAIRIFLLRQAGENDWLLRRTMVDQNMASIPRGIGLLVSLSLKESGAGHQVRLKRMVGISPRALHMGRLGVANAKSCQGVPHFRKQPSQAPDIATPTEGEHWVLSFFRVGAPQKWLFFWFPFHQKGVFPWVSLQKPPQKGAPQQTDEPAIRSEQFNHRWGNHQPSNHRNRPG